MTNVSDAIVVFITAANREEAGRLAEMLVREKLAACVQTLPEIESVYRWQGQIERQNETLLIAKSKFSAFAALDREVRRIHSYEAPEIVACPITAGSALYLKWLDENVSPDLKSLRSDVTAPK